MALRPAACERQSWSSSRSPCAPMQVAPVLEPQIVTLRPNYLCDSRRLGTWQPRAVAAAEGVWGAVRVP